MEARKRENFLRAQKPRPWTCKLLSKSGEKGSKPAKKLRRSKQNKKRDKIVDSGICTPLRLDIG
jgi:hypothetical protein